MAQFLKTSWKISHLSTFNELMKTQHDNVGLEVRFILSIPLYVRTPQCKQYRNINSNRVCREIRKFFSFFWLVLCEHLLLLDNCNYSTCMYVCENTKKRLKTACSAVRAVQHIFCHQSRLC
jgi:hypothetical protein